jgi:hypothetical protein
MLEPPSDRSALRLSGLLPARFARGRNDAARGEESVRPIGRSLDRLTMPENDIFLLI